MAICKLRYEMNPDKKSYTVTGIKGARQACVHIPRSYKGLPVTAIGKRAFNETLLSGAFVSKQARRELSDMEKIKKEYTKAGISDYVILKGATKDVESEYKKASLLIMTSYTEALPMVVIEAKACGVPAIAYECEGTRELINDSHDGYIIRNDDHEEFAAKITALINDKEKYMEFANNALKESEKFSDSRILELWRNLIIVC
jgi:glycosyltransferase involved in cell wall biosynthesis